MVGWDTETLGKSHLLYNHVKLTPAGHYHPHYYST